MTWILSIVVCCNVYGGAQTQEFKYQSREECEFAYQDFLKTHAPFSSPMKDGEERAYPCWEN